jgi:hypothetical protein
MELDGKTPFYQDQSGFAALLKQGLRLPNCLSLQRATREARHSTQWFVYQVSVPPKKMLRI